MSKITLTLKAVGFDGSIWLERTHKSRNKSQDLQRISAFMTEVLETFPHRLRELKGYEFRIETDRG